jgi:hypothetical protein
MKHLHSKFPALMLTLIVGLIGSSTAFGSATIVIENGDSPGAGFNDPTPVSAVGGNSGTTLGQQRLNAFQFAANIWGATLTSGPTITIRASWAALPCSSTSGTLGSAGNSGNIWRNFPGSVSGFWYGNALASALSGTDRNGATAEITAQFNSSLGTSGCLDSLHWYYGLDTNTDFAGVNLVTVLLHEFAHGLGFQTFTNSSTGAQVQGFPSIYDRFLFDNSTGKTWPEMTDPERVSSAINNRAVGWNGAQVAADSPTVLAAGKDSSGRPLVYTPSTLQSGSSVSHWDTSATPNQLMEPNITNGLTHSVTRPQDLTFALLKDIGWCSGCPQATPSPTPSPSPPANNNFANAQTISGCSGSVNGTNNGSNKESGEPSHSPDNDPGGGSVWYQWQAPANGAATITTAGSNFDTVLAVYQGNSVGALTTIGKNDDVNPGNVITSTLTFNVVANSVYKIAVDGWSNARGNIVLNWSLAGCSSKTNQTIAFSALANKVFGDAPFAVNATASSGLPVGFSILSGPASITGNTVTISGVGTVTVRASQAGDASFNAATPVDQSFIVAKANQTITFNALQNKAFGDAPFSVSAIASSGLPVAFNIVSGPATISGATISLTGLGVVTVRASQTGNTNYNAAASVDRTFTVAKGNQTITFNPLVDKNIGDASFTVNATATSGLPVSFSLVSTPATIATISGNTITITGAGVVTVRAAQAGDANFNAAASVDRTFTVAKANQTIIFNPLSGKTYGDGPFQVSASAGSALPVNFSVVFGPATISGATVSITGAGSVTVRASQAGDNNYNAAPSVDRTFAVAKANQTITFNPPSGKTFGDASFLVDAGASSGLPVSFSIFSGPASILSNSVTIAGAGTVTVRASQAGNANYNSAAPVDQSFIVNRANQSITFNALANRIFGDAPFEVISTSSSGLPVSFSIVSGPAAISSNTITLSGVGVITVRASQAGDANYSAATSVDRSFTVEGGTFQAAVLTTDQSTLKTWTLQGTTYIYLKLSFPNAGYRVANWGQVARAGNDFTADAAVEKFTGASVQAVTTTAQIYDLGPLANGTYNFDFKSSGTLTKTLQFTISSTVPPPNSIDDARQFVKQQYRDFLNREADQAGEDFWTDNITKCNDPARRPPGQTVEQCTLRQRETTSGAFFLSPEFQYTGYFVYRMYQGGLGRQPKLSEFIPDAQFVGNGIIVSGQLSGAVINQNKAAFAAQFVNCTDATKYRCAEFKAIYDPLNNTQYVDKLFLTTGVNASASDRAALANGLNGGTETRATVLQKVVDGINVISEGNQQFTTTYGQAFYNSEFNRAFVELEYFGYMKRDPDDAGYAFWLGKLNQFSGNFVNAEMVLAFISSPEYRAQFGQP